MLEPAPRGGLPSKLYYRIGEVAELVGVEPHVLRYWEREFHNIRPTKSAKGQRVYSRRDVENLLRVRQLLYGQGFTIAGAKKQLRHADALGSSPPAPAVASSSHEFDSPGEGRPDDSERESGSVALLQETRRQLLALRADIDAFLSELGLPQS